MYNGNGALDTLPHSHDVLSLAFRPDGKQLVSSTLDGTLTFWDPQEGKIQVRGRWREVRRGVGGGVTYKGS